MKLFDGKAEALELENRIKNHIKILGEKLPILAIVQVGDFTPSKKYVSIKKNYCEKLGIPIETHFFESTVSFLELQENISSICTREEVKSVIIQLPLPDQKFYSLLDLIPLTKDVDMLSSISQKNFYKNKNLLISPVLRAFEHFTSSVGINFSGLIVDVVGEGFLVGRPIAHYLQYKDARVNTFSLESNNPITSATVLKGDLVVLSADLPNLLLGEQIKAGAFVVDFGSAVVNGKLIGNLNMESNLQHLAVVSPALGGMGPLVVRYLIMNHLGI